MPVRCAITTGEDLEWQVTLRTTRPSAGSARQITLRFPILRVSGNDISGEVFLLSGGPKIADFIGTCHVAIADRLNNMTFEFPLGRAKFFVTGAAVAFDRDVNRFAGGFMAVPRTDFTEADLKLLSPDPPDSGDVGTGNGTQT